VYSGGADESGRTNRPLNEYPIIGFSISLPETITKPLFEFILKA